MARTKGAKDNPGKKRVRRTKEQLGKAKLTTSRVSVPVKWIPKVKQFIKNLLKNEKTN